MPAFFAAVPIGVNLLSRLKAYPHTLLRSPFCNVTKSGPIISPPCRKKPQITRFYQRPYLPEPKTRPLPAQMSVALRPLSCLWHGHPGRVSKSSANNRSRSESGPDFVERLPAAAVSIDSARPPHRTICQQRHPIADSRNRFRPYRA